MAEENVVVQSQADMWEHIYAFGDSMILKCAMKLGVADIVNKHGNPITISQIAGEISSSPSLNINYLFRIMRFLVCKQLFTSEYKDGDTFYSLSHTGKWLLRDAEFTLAPLLEMQTNECWLDAWHHLDKCVLEGGGTALQKAHGTGLWDIVSGNPEYNKLFNGAMACTAKIVVNAILSTYNGFNGITSLVDVGGGTGMMIREIVNAHPHITGINFDLPHVLATTPEYPGVVHVPGDMFVQIPQADVVIMKWILHSWSDEDCVNILQNCHKVVASNGRKVIIVDVVLNPEGRGPFDRSVMTYDLVMMAISGGRERTESEWQKILQDGGFPTYKIIRIPAILSIIEAYPN